MFGRTHRDLSKRKGIREGSKFTGILGGDFCSQLDRMLHIRKVDVVLELVVVGRGKS